MDGRGAPRRTGGCAGAFGKGRVEAFSDGVMAVAITLLVLDLRVPEPGGTGGLGHRLAALWPNYLAYVISFVAIGILWINHHTMLRRLRDVDHSVLVLNLLLLLCIVVLPFTTALLSSYLVEEDGGRLAAVVYAGSFLVTSAVFLALQFHVLTHRRRLLREPLTGAERRTILRRAAAAPPAYLVAGGLGLVTPYLTLAVCVAMGLFYLAAPPR
ncbi:TMEM175 family protein [Tomitella gaofuii]|uniref:TMEM175 family protein n=1 Tax=Tomitella gaofuii TaxID=2760083 RepID=UPI0015FC2276|nr:TMEM175 family protein [Tomitella gaofuii]